MNWIKIVLEVIVSLWDILRNRKKEEAQKSPEEIKQEKQEVKDAIETHDPSEITRAADRIRNRRR